MRRTAREGGARAGGAVAGHAALTLSRLRPLRSPPSRTFRSSVTRARRRCRGLSRVRISPRYPLVEALTGIAFALATWKFGPSAAAAGAMLFIAAMIALTFIDFDKQLVARRLTLPLLWAGLLFNAFGVFADLKSAVLGAAAGYLLLWSGLLAVQARHRQGGHGIRRFQAARRHRRLDRLGHAAADILLSSFVGAIVGHRADGAWPSTAATCPSLSVPTLPPPASSRCSGASR